MTCPLPQDDVSSCVCSIVQREMTMITLIRPLGPRTSVATTPQLGRLWRSNAGSSPSNFEIAASAIMNATPPPSAYILPTSYQDKHGVARLRAVLD